ncbi:MAG: sigma-70 family RNA polymerase sigma factor [bacterium]
MPRRPSLEERRVELERLPDATLLERCTARDELAWEILVRRYRKLVYAVPFRARLPSEAVEEVFHATFARLSERIDTVRDRSKVRAWMVTTARRLTIDAIRRRAAMAAHEELDAAGNHVVDPQELASEQMESLERRHLVRQALLRLGERCRRLLRLLFYDTSDPPRSYESIARELGMPLGSLGPTRARCLVRLREELKTLEDG